jgi:chemotaxis protein MotB
MSQKKFVEDPKPSVPGYIVTFSDMITLLLTFFVMLLSMAQTQVEKHKFEVGVYSFRRAISDFGMSGLLISRANSSTFEHPKVFYRVDSGQDEPENRSIDAKTEMLRRVLMDIEQMMKISPSHIVGAQKTVFPSNIRFSTGGWELNDSARSTLKKLTENLKINYSQQEPSIYILGLAADASEPQQWAVSARRAETAAESIRQLLGQDMTWPIYCWGAGPGGEWIGQSGLVTRETHILITVLTETR